MRPEEQVECAIEARRLVVPVDEQASQRRRDIGAAADVDPFERADRVQQAAVMHLEPRRAQHASEQQDVEGQVHEPAPRASARLSIACRRSPRTAWMSSWFLSRMPSVSSTVPASSSSRSSATSAAAQSSVSETPARLVELGRPQLLDERGHLLGEPRRHAPAPWPRRCGARSPHPDSRSSSTRSGASARRGPRASGST